jgi:predicted Zn-dependent protease
MAYPGGYSRRYTRGGIKLLPIVLGLIAMGFVAVRGCQEGPFGRNQIVALSADQESRLGAQAFHEVLQQSDVIGGGPTVDAVTRVARRLARAAEEPAFLQRVQLDKQKFDWAVRVVRSKQVNAFCLPGGKIVVYTGILPLAETEGGLATVMGHEIGHALAHHGAERMAQQQLVQIGQVAAAGSISDLDPQQQRNIMILLNAGAQYGVLLPYSRKHETEADHLGLLLMAAAGYDPRESARFWQRMQQATGRGPSEFASTHPSHETRIRDLQGWMDEALVLYRASDKAPDEDKPLPLPDGRR